MLVVEDPPVGDRLAPVAVARLGERLVVDVGDAGLGGVDELPPGGEGPLGPVEVLQPGERLVVGERPPRLGAHGAVGVVAERRLLVVVADVGEPRAQQLELGEVAAAVAGLAAVDEPDLGSLERRHHQVEPLLVERVHVGADDHEDVAGRRGAAEVERPPERELRRGDVHDLGAVGLGDGDGVVDRPRVDEDHLVGLRDWRSNPENSAGRCSASLRARITIDTVGMAGRRLLTRDRRPNVDAARLPT